ncbi:MAG: MaoC family dehydratase N-terminal domain-containing protein [Deltaproteobacteria bacterium]|nr:MaoC family dehydratase N-terminal domain-containing protein [Deltaproteobacteria bacterium]
MDKSFYEDCRVGDRVLSPGRTITEGDVVSFAALTGDWNAIHTNAEIAAAGPFGARIAHGMFILALAISLPFRPNWNALIPGSLIALSGVDKVRFLAPVKLGDTVCSEGEIAEMQTLDPGTGLLSVRYTVRNQRGEEVLACRVKAVVGRRPQGTPGAES